MSRLDFEYRYDGDVVLWGSVDYEALTENTHETPTWLTDDGRISVDWESLAFFEIDACSVRIVEKPAVDAFIRGFLKGDIRKDFENFIVDRIWKEGEWHGYERSED
jgi:hypothetical protein